MLFSANAQRLISTLVEHSTKSLLITFRKGIDKLIGIVHLGKSTNILMSMIFQVTEFNIVFNGHVVFGEILKGKTHF
ncbi:MAG: hypothetical protein ACI9Z3_000896 [Roseivirga sp.]|jgi:hypothetical protein